MRWAFAPASGSVIANDKRVSPVATPGNQRAFRSSLALRHKMVPVTPVKNSIACSGHPASAVSWTTNARSPSPNPSPPNFSGRCTPEKTLGA